WLLPIPASPCSNSTDALPYPAASRWRPRISSSAARPASGISGHPDATPAPPACTPLLRVFQLRPAQTCCDRLNGEGPGESRRVAHEYLVSCADTYVGAKWPLGVDSTRPTKKG